MNYLNVDYQDSVAVVTLDQPGEKVNKLNEQLVEEFSSLLDDLEQNNDLRGVILTSGKVDSFIAGADLDMIRSKNRAAEISALSEAGQKVLNRLENLSIPVVAAIHGAALGGGLEVALACHYRVASTHSKTHMGQPEVKLGLLPAAGGTQRLPRLIGLQKSLTYLLTGKNIYPHKAKKIGLVDELTHKDAVVTAARQAIEKLDNGKYQRKDRRSIVEKVLEGNPLGRKIIFSQARKRTQSRTHDNYPAPSRIINCVETGYKEGIQKGFDLEARLFGDLAMTREAGELINLFFQMNKAKKSDQRQTARPVQNVGILGAGLMGSGIADVSAGGGYRIILKDQTVEQAAAGKKRVWDRQEKQLSKHIITKFERDKTLARVTPSGNYKGFRHLDLVIEAVFENLELKQSILAEVERYLSDKAIYASNTSSLPIKKIASEARRPGQVIGMHYFSPVPKMPLLEIVKTDQTPQWVLATAREVGIRQGKTVIAVNDGPGFYTTRILAPLINEALLLLTEGGDVKEIDRAMKHFGYPVGPLQLLDEVGIDVGAHVAEVMTPMFKDRGVEPSMKAVELLNNGFEGKKNQKGFYQYESGKKKKREVNSEIYQFFGSGRRKHFSSEVIQQRIALSMINEALWCLQEQILDRPVDGDLGAVLGLGFPPFLGGPFRYVDQQGAANVLEQLDSLQKQHGTRFKAADLLRQQVKKGERFYNN